MRKKLEIWLIREAVVFGPHYQFIMAEGCKKSCTILMNCHQIGTF